MCTQVPWSILVPGPWNGHFWFAAHLLPPGGVHYKSICPLWLPADLLPTNNVGVVIPNVYVTNPAVIPEPENSPPNYSEVPGDK